MKKISPKLQVGILLISLLFVGIYCSKKEVNSDDSKQSIKIDQATKTSSKSKQQINKEIKNSKHLKERVLPIPKSELGDMAMSSSTGTYECYSMMLGEYQYKGYHTYPQYYMDFSSSLGRTVSFPKLRPLKLELPTS